MILTHLYVKPTFKSMMLNSRCMDKSRNTTDTPKYNLYIRKRSYSNCCDMKMFSWKHNEFCEILFE